MKNSIYSVVKILVSTKNFYFEIEKVRFRRVSDLPKVTNSHCTQNSHFRPLVLDCSMSKKKKKSPTQLSLGKEKKKEKLGTYMCVH